MGKNKRVRLYSKKSWENANKDNKFLLDDYMMELEARGIAESTRKQYFSDIRGFMCYLYDEHDDIYILDVTRRMFRNFYIMYRRSNTSAARINRHQVAVRRLLDYAHKNEDDYDYDRNIMSSIEGLPSETVREIVFLSDDEIKHLIEHYVGQEDYQLALCFSLAYDSSGRRNEIYQVTKQGFEDIDNRTTNTVVGKRSKEFVLYYSERTAKIAKKYLEQRGEDDIDSLWITTDAAGNKSKVSYNTLYYWVIASRDVLEEYNGELKEYNFHSFRHAGMENLSNGSHHMLEELGKEDLDIDTLRILANHRLAVA